MTTREHNATTLWLLAALALLPGCGGGAGLPARSEAVANANAAANAAVAVSPAARPEQSAQPGQPARAEMSDADYEPIPLDRLAGTAQLIVAGEVSKVGETTFTLRPTLTLAGESQTGEIEVRQFIPSRFEGAPRPAPYRPGQTFLLFLFRDERAGAGNAWRILGAGGEGEMPVEDGFVYFHGRHVEGLPAGAHRVHGAERNIQRYDAQVFFDAVRKYRDCFEWKPGRGELPEPARKCDKAAAEQYARTSDIHRHLARLTTLRLRD